MKTNILSLSFRRVAETDKSPALLVGELRVDGSRLGEGYVLDVRRLADALTREGEHFIFTCGCGEPGCAGIHEGVRSRISETRSSSIAPCPRAGHSPWPCRPPRPARLWPSCPWPRPWPARKVILSNPDGLVDGKALGKAVEALSRAS